jgi:hypothetical protein
MAGLSVVSSPQENFSFNPKVQSAPASQPKAPLKVSPKPTTPLPAKLPVVSQPAGVPQQISVQPMAPQPQINVDNSPRFARLGQQVKAKYPGVYDSLDDGQLGKIVAEKFPGAYDSLIDSSTPVASEPEGKSVLGFGKNVVTSAGRLIKDTATGLKDIFNPNKEENTAFNLYKLAVGGAEKLIPGEQGQEQAFDNVTEFFKQRYGSKDAFLETLYNDPAGVLSDLSTVISGGAGTVSKLGTLSKVTGVANAAGKVSTVNKVIDVANTVSKVGSAIDPINIATKGLGVAARTTGRVVGESLGVTTGAGYGSIREAFRNPSPEFTQALRGKVPTESIVADAREALQGIRDQRSADYLNNYKKVWEQTGKTEQNLNSVKEQLFKQLDNFNVKVIKNAEEGKLNFDFSRSTISDGMEANRVREVVEAVYGWGDQAGDSTVVGLDLLKRKLDDFYSSSRQANAFIAPIKQQVRTILERVPEYKKMTREYAEISNIIDDIQGGLSLTNKASTETTLKKLTSVLRDNNEFRKAMVEQLQKYSDSDLKGQIAGASLGQVAPRGLMRTVVGGGVMGTASLILSPAFLASLPLASPRIVGEFLRVLGLTNKQVQQVLDALKKTGLGKISTPIRQGAYQLERTDDDNQ